MEKQEGRAIGENLVVIPTSKVDTVSELMRGGIIEHIENASLAQISRESNMVKLEGNPQEIECAEHLLRLAMNENIMELKYKTLWVPTQKVGSIIGEKHKTIIAIKHASAANINIEKTVERPRGAPPKDTTSIRIIGMQQEQIDYAEECTHYATNGSLHFNTVRRKQYIDEGTGKELLGPVYEDINTKE